MSDPAFVGYPPNPSTAASWLRVELQRLHAAGHRSILGPLPHSTWHPYRLVTWSDGSPPFLLESPQMFLDPAPWHAAGFRQADAYLSTRVPLDPDPRLDPVRLRLANVRLRPIQRDHYDEDLRALHRLCLRSFANNAWYSPISEPDFLALYRPFRDSIDPDYVLFAENTEGLCGFVFSAIDPQRRELIIKTLAILPGRRCAGLGALLVDAVHRRAREQGLTHAIHALMHDANASRNTARHSEVIRRYHLFRHDT